MHRVWSLIIGTVGFVMLLPVIVQPQGSPTVLQNFHVSGSGANANFTFVDGDIVTFVFVSASADRDLEPPQQGGPSSDPVASLVLVRGNQRTGEHLVGAQGFTRDFSLTIS